MKQSILQRIGALLGARFAACIGIAAPRPEASAGDPTDVVLPRTQRTAGHEQAIFEIALSADVDDPAAVAAALEESKRQANAALLSVHQKMAMVRHGDDSPSREAEKGHRALRTGKKHKRQLH